MKFRTHEYDYKGRNLASTAVTQYYSGVGYSPSLFIIILLVLDLSRKAQLSKGCMDKHIYALTVGPLSTVYAQIEASSE